MIAPPDAEAALAGLTEALRPELAAHPHSILVGIETGGVWVAERLHAALSVETPLGRLNVGFHRDDFSTSGLHPNVGPSRLTTPLDGRRVVLVDDILFTGRTVRAALNELFDHGRPAAVKLAVLIDRDARELPFAPNAAGMTVHLEPDQRMKLAGPSPLQLTLS